MIIFCLFLGVYTPEPLWDFSWAAVSVGNMYMYHFITLQYLAYVSTCIWQRILNLLLSHSLLKDYLFCILII
jgi:hypothetical protein